MAEISMPDYISDGGDTYHRALPERASSIKGASTLHTSTSIESYGLPEYAKFIDVAQKEIVGKIAPATVEKPYLPAEHRVVSLNNVTVYNFARTEGMMTCEERFVRETVGSARAYPENPHIRNYCGPDQDPLHWWYFKVDNHSDSERDSGLIAFDPATHNYAHFWGVFFQRLVFARHIVKDTAIYFPDVPNYSEYNPGSTRNEHLYRLSEILPPSNGNFYAPLPPGKHKFRSVQMVQQVPNRWDLMFYPEVNEQFDRLSSEALARSRLIYGKEAAKKIYISRRGATRRRIINEDELIAFLSDQGFSIYQTEHMDIWDQMALFAAAEVVVSPHGAGCANVLFCQAGAKFIEIHPDPLPSLQFAHSALARKVHYRPVPTKPLNRLRDFNVDITSVRWALEN